MALYNYKGMEKSGKDVKGSVTAESVLQAKQKVKTMGIMLCSQKSMSKNLTP